MNGNIPKCNHFYFFTYFLTHHFHTPYLCNPTPTKYAIADANIPTNNVSNPPYKTLSSNTYPLILPIPANVNNAKMNDTNFACAPSMKINGKIGIIPTIINEPNVTNDEMYGFLSFSNPCFNSVSELTNRDTPIEKPSDNTFDTPKLQKK